jgi:hypothetical protein
VNKEKKATRPAIDQNTKIAVWAAAAGRCTVCNEYILENEDMGEPVPIGELAHNVGWGEDSPRGKAVSDLDRSSADNLLLLCRNCHKPIDQKGVVGRYDINKLKSLKLNHERRIRELTAIGGDKQAVVIRMVGDIRGVSPELTYDTVLEATVASCYFPRLLPRMHRAEIEIDMRGHAKPGTVEYFAACARQIDERLAAVHDGVRQDDSVRLAVFAFARIPLLVHLGARLDDKVSTLIFQRQRIDGPNAWRWPEASTDAPPRFEVAKLREGKNRAKIALLLNLSGTIKPSELPADVDADYAIYTLTPTAPSTPNPSLISSPEALANFESEVRRLLAALERDHGKVDSISVFPAIPLSCAVTLGRTLMPNVSPALKIFDRDENGNYFAALEVRR